MLGSMLGLGCKASFWPPDFCLIAVQNRETLPFGRDKRGGSWAFGGGFKGGKAEAVWGPRESFPFEMATFSNFSLVPSPVAKPL